MILRSLNGTSSTESRGLRTAQENPNGGDSSSVESKFAAAEKHGTVRITGSGTPAEHAHPLPPAASRKKGRERVVMVFGTFAVRRTSTWWRCRAIQDAWTDNVINCTGPLVSKLGGDEQYVQFGEIRMTKILEKSCAQTEGRRCGRDEKVNVNAALKIDGPFIPGNSSLCLRLIRLLEPFKHIHQYGSLSIFRLFRALRVPSDYCSLSSLNRSSSVVIDPETFSSAYSPALRCLLTLEPERELSMPLLGSQDVFKWALVFVRP
ncbi:hypothetical protein BJ912DRAFT_931212 [Pholiota molesta]|nr:hypothetical protein BJ912DRAFT_931212 [Pholiota molesta]